jgi:N-methylhydantoinase B/oxoprolinase/acetone carboxylase alpha subunit
MSKVSDLREKVIDKIDVDDSIQEVDDLIEAAQDEVWKIIEQLCYKEFIISGYPESGAEVSCYVMRKGKTLRETVTYSTAKQAILAAAKELGIDED